MACGCRRIVFYPLKVFLCGCLFGIDQRPDGRNRRNDGGTGSSQNEHGLCPGIFKPVENRILYRMGIEPMGAIDKASRLVEKRTWKQAASAETSEEQGSRQSETVTGDERATNQDQERPASSLNVEATPIKQGNGRSQQDGAHGHQNLRAKPKIATRTEPENQPIAGQPELSPVEEVDGVQLALRPTASSLKAQDWFAMAKWAKEKNYLSSWQRKFAFHLGVRVNRGIEISDKQSPFAVQLLEEAIKLGYEVSG
jgi:hypothetical protein